MDINEASRVLAGVCIGLDSSLPNVGSKAPVIGLAEEHIKKLRLVLGFMGFPKVVIKKDTTEKAPCPTMPYSVFTYYGHSPTASSLLAYLVYSGLDQITKHEKGWSKDCLATVLFDQMLVRFPALPIRLPKDSLMVELPNLRGGGIYRIREQWKRLSWIDTQTPLPKDGYPIGIHVVGKDGCRSVIRLKRLVHPMAFENEMVVTCDQCGNIGNAMHREDDRIATYEELKTVIGLWKK